MANLTRNFIAGRMNKVVDQRLLPEGEYVDAMNIRMGSTEKSEVGVITNTKGNTSLTKLAYIDGTPLSVNARCIGAIDDSARETIYWFVHDPSFTTTESGANPTGKLDLLVSYNVLTEILTYHIVSMNDGGDVNTTLNFNPSYLITGINLIEDLLFFTDDYNQPRFINIKRNYPNPVLNIDALNAESILVIKKPPTQSPLVYPIVTSGQENYLETRFVCFAYRYRYIDGEYSATSQWSAPAFIPRQFSFSTSSVLNEGMTNLCNAAIVKYNSGGPLVVGIDLLFKQSENNIIKVIQKIDKAEDGLADNTEYEISFNNSKIFTILNEAEILRLYDNVPLLAKAQTIMGNRLMYGNYVEGYNLIDKYGQPTRFEYSTELIFEEIGSIDVIDDTETGLYNIDPSETPDLNIGESIITFDLTDRPLVEGASIFLNITINHASFSGTDPFPSNETENVEYSFSFLLTRDYSSVYELATSAEFLNSVGTLLNILPVSTTTPGQDTSCAGITFTDSFNCLLPQSLGDGVDIYFKYGSGIDGILEPIRIITSPGSNIIGLQFPAMEYVDDITTPTKRIYEYYKVIFASVVFQEIANPRSLHSNRGYEIGIVYMDEFNRATTALVSPYNAEYIPCGYSTRKNMIHVTIPVTQIAPKFAKRYKFVIKPDEERYETIYSFLYFTNPETNEVWLLLEGENMQKVENGDRLIVKADSDGPAFSCIYTTVLDKQAQPSGFLEIPTEEDPDVNINVPAGLYIKLRPNNFNLFQEENAIIAPGRIRRWASGGDHLQMPYPMNIEGTDPDNPTWTFLDYSVPAGSKIDWKVDWNRAGVGGNCLPRGYNLEKVYTSSADYENMYEWFLGENIQLTINSGTDKGDDETNVFIPGLNRRLDEDLLGTTTGTAAFRLIDSTATFITDGVVAGVKVNAGGIFGSTEVESVVSETELILERNIFTSGMPYRLIWENGDINFWRFYRDTVTNELQIWFSSTFSCDGRNYKYSRRIYITAEITVFRAEDVIIFETEPSDSLPDVFFENELSFEIDENGNHMGNIQNQDIAGGIPAIIDTQFFNCFAFGNGAESYKIRDSIIGRPFNFGERVTTVAEQDYKESDRFSDITYSGVYNEESNLNKLNEFNKGLSNYKNCEASFGEIFLLDARSTDVLTLQEDKISYVLAGKNLLSDASAGNIITATPEVLGTQISRTEKYGISFNPESYVQWGADRYFTDVKRGAVIHLKGSEAQSDQLFVSSEDSMRTWFRDEFNASFNTQKLGGFDPYMNEYVLALNDRPLPVNQQCLNCGISQTFTLSVNEEVSKEMVYCVDLGAVVGFTEISWLFTSVEEGATLQVSVDYNGVIEDSLATDENGSISFNKNSVSVETAEITLTYTGDMVVSVLVNCPNTEEMTIVEVVLTNDSEGGQTIHTQYRYTDGAFIGPLFSNLVLFSTGAETPLVSRYNLLSGIVGTGGFPQEDSIMRLYTNKISPDDYVFDIAQDKFRYLRTSVLYENNSVDIESLITASSLATPISGATPVYYADFTVPESVNGQYLYLIWDLRDAISTELCFGEALINACCGCIPDFYYLNASFADSTSIFTDANMTTYADNGFYTFEGTVRELVDGVLLPAQTCGNCEPSVYCFEIPLDVSYTISYIDEFGETTEITGLGDDSLISVIAIVILSYEGAILVDCNTEPALRSDIGIVDPEVVDGCSEALEIPIFIVTSVTGEINSGDVACNSEDPLDTFDGGGLYYRLSLDSDPSNSKVCLVGVDGVISVYSICF
jgi:hypothetical protein